LIRRIRVLGNAKDTARRLSPIEVAVPGYSGFKLSILAATPGRDWAAIVATAKGSDGSWSVLGKNVKDASIRNLVKAIQDGLSGAVERKDVHGVKFAAKMQLEVGDVLEQYFASGLKSGGVGRP
jgi:hypothetical protein